MKLLPLFLLSFFSAILSAQTVGQYELRKRGSAGFTSYGVTLSNGQVIGQTAGVPAAITPLVSGDLAPYLTSATAASTYATIAHNQAWSTITSTPTTLAGYGITDAITAATAASTYLPLTGGTLTGNLITSGSLNFGGGSYSGNLFDRTITITYSGGRTASLFFPNLASGSGNRTYLLPDNSTASTQTLISTADTGTVTNAMLANSSITINGSAVSLGGSTTISTGLTIGSTAITGGTSGRLLTSGTTVGELTLGSGVSTWLGTPTLANLNSAVSDADLATTGANTLTGTQTIVQATANAAAIVASGYSLTGSNATSMLDFSGTWNTSGAPTALKLNITNTASSISALLVDVLVNSSSRFAIDPRGQVGLGGAASIPSAHSVTSGYEALWFGGSKCAFIGEPAAGYRNIAMVANVARNNAGSWTQVDATRNSFFFTVGFESNSNGLFLYRAPAGSGNSFSELFRLDENSLRLASTLPLAWSTDTFLRRQAAGILWQSNSTSAQTFSVANTYTSSTNHEAFTIDWQTTSNTVRVGTVKGSGGGTARDMIIQTDGTERIRIKASGVINFSGLPTSSAGLSSGDLWLDSNTLKIVP